MIKPQLEVVWRLREVMAERGLFMTTELIPLLKPHGVELSREQIYRIATSVPQRLSLDLLGALCEVLECSPNDLIQYKRVSKRKRAVGGGAPEPKALKDIHPVEARIVRPNFRDED
jgi:DNA-binding Xre family transcriptional regulator